MAGIISDCHTLGLLVYFCDVVCKTLSCSSYYIDVHAVGSGSDDSTETCGTELQIHIKTFFDLIIIFCNIF